MHGDDGVERIGLAGEHGPGFEFLGKRGQSLDVALQIGEHVFALAREFEVGFDIAGAANKFVVVADEGFKPLAVAHEGLAGRRIGPQRRIG